MSFDWKYETVVGAVRVSARSDIYDNYAIWPKEFDPNTKEPIGYIKKVRKEFVVYKANKPIAKARRLADARAWAAHNFPTQKSQVNKTEQNNSGSGFLFVLAAFIAALILIN